MGKGIDYSGPLGTCNRDSATGIRYGVIPLHNLGEFAHESFEAEYDAMCPSCGTSWPDDLAFDLTEAPTRSGNVTVMCSGWFARCPSCEAFIREDEQFFDEPSRHVLKETGYAGSLDSSNDVWVFLSPYFTRAAFCSPCAPGACYLSSPCDDGERAYCFGPDFFDEESPAPYPIYSVATGERIV